MMEPGIDQSSEHVLEVWPKVAMRVVGVLMHQLQARKEFSQVSGRRRGWASFGHGVSLRGDLVFFQSGKVQEKSVKARKTPKLSGAFVYVAGQRAAARGFDSVSACRLLVDRGGWAAGVDDRGDAVVLV